MNRSKWQVCTEILCNLASNGPMNLANLSLRINLTQHQLKRHLKLLQDSSLIIKQNFGKNKIFFIITENGLAAIKMFRAQVKMGNETQVNELKTTILL